MKKLIFLSITILLSLSVSRASSPVKSNNPPHPIYFQNVQNLQTSVSATIECRETTTIKFHIVYNGFVGKFGFDIGNYSSNSGFTITGNGTANPLPEYRTITVPAGTHTVCIDRSYPISYSGHGTPFLLISEVSGNNYIGSAYGQPYLSIQNGW